MVKLAATAEVKDYELANVVEKYDKSYYPLVWVSPSLAARNRVMALTPHRYKLTIC